MAANRPFLIDISGTCSIGKASAVDFDIVTGMRSSKAGNFIYASLKTQKSGGIGLTDLLMLFDESKEGSPDIPDFLKDLPAIKEFTISYGTGERSSEFTLRFKTLFSINGKRIKASIHASYRKKENTSSFTFGGILEVDKHRFKLSFSKVSEDWYLYAGYLYQEKVVINFRRIATILFDDESVIPDISCTLENFKAFLLYKKPAKGDTALLWGMGAGLELDLKELPLAGPVLSQNGAFEFKEVLAMYSSGTFTKDELDTCRESSDGLWSDLPDGPIAPGFNLSVELLINGKTESYALNGDLGKILEPSDDIDLPIEKNIQSTEVSSLAGSVSSKAKWKKLDKKIGPVIIQRLGFLFDEGKVVLLLDASVLMAGMGIQLVGLGLGFKLEWKFPPDLPDFYIDGLGLSFVKDPIRISGMFLRADPAKGVEQYSYYGAAQLSLSRFGISGIGAYSKLIEPRPDGAVSFFIYAMYNGPIGGPAFFFVNGIAAGFGYNRRVRVPTIREVNEFPLVAMALSPKPEKTLNDVLGELVAGQWVPASPGDYWLAIGIKFSSFNIIDSFVLVIVQFGTRVEFSILGLSILAWPTKEKAIAYIELAVKINYGTDSDLISVEAMLTPNSYLLDKNCRLTGGFAFYVWVKGEHEGDFVVTLGGYHPKFNKPAHYPDVDRLGLNWKLSKYLQIKGGMYFALTPSCIMAGGRLDVIFDMGFLKATISAWIDMVIGWAPYQYGVDIGIIVKIVANINLGLFRIHFQLEMGADLHIWGPPFAGEAHVNWNIFSFTIPFGDTAKRTNQELNWNEFKQQFLSSETGKKITPEISIQEGVINEFKAVIDGKEVKCFVVNPHQLKINVEAPLPVTTLYVPDTAGAEKEMPDKTIMLVDGKALNYSERNQTLGIRPMKQTRLQSKLKVSVMQNDQVLKGHLTPEYAAYASGVPESLWSHQPRKGDDDHNSNQPDDTRVLKNVLKGIIIRAKKAPVPVEAPMFDLEGKFEIINDTFRWTYVAALTGPDNIAYGNRKKEKIVETLNDAAILAKRQAIINGALEAQDAEIEKLDENINEWVEELRTLPIIVQLGGLPQ